MEPTPTNFKDYWHLDTIDGKPISWFLQHPGFKYIPKYFTGEDPIDDDSLDDIICFLEEPETYFKNGDKQGAEAIAPVINGKELLPLFYYFVAHIVSMEPYEYIDNEDTSYLCDLLWERPEVFCDFFMEKTPQKTKALNNLIYCKAWDITTPSTWEEDLEKHKNELLAKMKELSLLHKQFVEEYLNAVGKSCRMQS